MKKTLAEVLNESKNSVSKILESESGHYILISSGAGIFTLPVDTDPQYFEDPIGLIKQKIERNNFCRTSNYQGLWVSVFTPESFKKFVQPIIDADTTGFIRYNGKRKLPLFTIDKASYDREMDGGGGEQTAVWTTQQFVKESNDTLEKAGSSIRMTSKT